MMTISSRAAALAFAASLIFAGAAYAQTPAASPAPATSPAPAAAPAAKTKKPRTAASIECSKEADAKGLKGKERKKFRSECKRQAKTTAAPASK